MNVRSMNIKPSGAGDDSNEAENPESIGFACLMNPSLR